MDSSQFQGLNHLIIPGRAVIPPSPNIVFFKFLPMSDAKKPNPHFTYATIRLPLNWEFILGHILHEIWYSFQENDVSTIRSVDEQAVILAALNRFFQGQLHLEIFNEMRYFTALEFCNNIRLITDEDGDKLRFPCDVEELKNELPF